MAGTKSGCFSPDPYHRSYPRTNIIDTKDRPIPEHTAGLIRGQYKVPWPGSLPGPHGAAFQFSDSPCNFPILIPSLPIPPRPPIPSRDPNTLSPVSPYVPAPKALYNFLSAPPTRRTTVLSHLIPPGPKFSHAPSNATRSHPHLHLHLHPLSKSPEKRGPLVTPALLS